MNVKLKKRQSKAVVKVPPNIALHRLNGNIQVFYYKKVQQRPKKDKENEFKNLWVTHHYIYAQESFPSLSRKMPVVWRVAEELSPIENAVLSVQEKNEQLYEETKAAAMQPPGPTDTGRLAMLLNGVIDAAVNGGTKLYVLAFLDPQFLVEHPEPQFAQLQIELATALNDQVTQLRSSVKVFTDRCGDSMMPLAERLKGMYTREMSPFVAKATRGLVR